MSFKRTKITSNKRSAFDFGCRNILCKYTQKFNSSKPAKNARTDLVTLTTYSVLVLQCLQTCQLDSLKTIDAKTHHQIGKMDSADDPPIMASGAFGSNVVAL